VIYKERRGENSSWSKRKATRYCPGNFRKFGYLEKATSIQRLIFKKDYSIWCRDAQALSLLTA